VPHAIYSQNDRYIVFFIVAPLVVCVVGIVKSDHEVRLHVNGVEVIGDDFGVGWKFLNELLQGGDGITEIGAEHEYASHFANRNDKYKGFNF
jgi:hypothetical protein